MKKGIEKIGKMGKKNLEDKLSEQVKGIKKFNTKKKNKTRFSAGELQNVIAHDINVSRKHLSKKNVLNEVTDTMQKKLKNKNKKDKKGKKAIIQNSDISSNNKNVELGKSLKRRKGTGVFHPKINSPNAKESKGAEKESQDKMHKLKMIKEKRRKEKVGVVCTNQKQKKKHKLNIKRLEEILLAKENTNEQVKKNVKTEPKSLRERMMDQLRGSRFRYINETLYNNKSFESKKYFKDDPDAFTAYHDGYKQQVQQWPLNPLDTIISSIVKMPKDYVIADFGCGEAKLANSVTQKVHSFDFVAMNDKVTACDMAHTPLLTNSANVVVFCLSLMGTNLGDYLIEANRVLKKDGLLKIAEVESRFDNVEGFIKSLSDYGFTNTWKDLNHSLFYFMDFKKEKDIGGNRSKLSPVTLKPCLYKKR